MILPGWIIRRWQMRDDGRRQTREDFGPGRQRGQILTAGRGFWLTNLVNTAVIVTFNKGFGRFATAMPFGHATFHRASVRLLRPHCGRQNRPAKQEDQQRACRPQIDLLQLA